MVGLAPWRRPWQLPALWQNLSGGHFVRRQHADAATGAQPAHGSDERYQTSYRRKLREAYLVWQLECHYSKGRVAGALSQPDVLWQFCVRD